MYGCGSVHSAHSNFQLFQVVRANFVLHATMHLAVQPAIHHGWIDGVTYCKPRYTDVRCLYWPWGVVAMGKGEWYLIMSVVQLLS